MVRVWAIAFASSWVLVLLGCATAAKEPASTAPMATPTARPGGHSPSPLPAAVVRHGELSMELARKLGAAKTCSAVANELDNFVRTHRGELMTTSDALAAWEETASRAELQAYYRKVFPAIEVRIDAGIRCKDHRGATGAFDRFFAATGLDRPAR